VRGEAGIRTSQHRISDQIYGHRPDVLTEFHNSPTVTKGLVKASESASELNSTGDFARFSRRARSLQRLEDTVGVRGGLLSWCRR
jgi:hypothetical protein